VSISDGACDPEDTRSLGATLRYILRQAAIAGAESVRARLPLDPSLYDLYRDSSCGFVPSLWQSSEGGNMLQVLSLRGLLKAIAPKLTERLRTAEQATGEVGLRVQRETIGLAWDGERVTVEEAKGDWVELGQDRVMKLVLGLVPVEQIVGGDMEDVAMLRAAFPVQRTATYRESDEEGHQSSRIDYAKPMDSKKAGHPFEMCISTISTGMPLCDYHSHLTQWEFYYVLSGKGHVRLEEGNVPIQKGDAIMCHPGEPHQVVNDGEVDLIVQIIANNPQFDACFYPDRDSWGFAGPDAPSELKGRLYRL
jgi:uncharacterized cupin superfamily protein